MEPETESLVHWLTGFRLSKEAEGISPNTLIEYWKDFAHFRRWCAVQRKPDPTALTPTDLKSFLASLRSESNGRGGTLSPKTVRNAWVALRSFYRWLSVETALANPMLAVPMPRSQSSVVEPLTREEVSSILRACDFTNAASTKARTSYAMRRPSSARDRAIILTLLDSGLRSSELCALKLDDLDLSSGRILVRSGKGGKARVTYIGKMCRKAVWRYLKDREATTGEPLFQSHEGRPMTGDRLVKLFANLGERAGVADLHPHRLRHSFATEFLRNGGNLLGLQRLLGHSSLEMVKRYASIVDADLAKAHETGSPADKWRL